MSCLPGNSSSASSSSLSTTTGTIRIHEETGRRQANAIPNKTKNKMESNKNKTEEMCDIPDLLQFKWQLNAMKEKVRRYHSQEKKNNKVLKNRELSEQLKLRGNQLLNEKKLQQALNCYNEVMI